MTIIQSPSPNFSQRSPVPIDTVLIHNTGGMMPGTLAWLRNPNSVVSAHYLVTRKPEIHQLVPEAMKAWHGEHWNSRSIGIEVEAYQKTGLGFAPGQEAVLLWLVADILRRYKLPVTAVNMHRKVNRTACPSLIFPTDSDFYTWRSKLLTLRDIASITPTSKENQP